MRSNRDFRSVDSDGRAIGKAVTFSAVHFYRRTIVSYRNLPPVVFVGCLPELRSGKWSEYEKSSPIDWRASLKLHVVDWQKNSTAARLTTAGGFENRESAFIGGEAGCVFGAELKEDSRRCDAGGGERILSDGLVFVLDFDGKITRLDEWLSDGKNLRELGRFQAVCKIGRDPDLKEAGVLLSNCAAAVDEVLSDASDFGDVEVRGNFLATRESKLDRLIGIVGKKVLEFLDGHDFAFLFGGRTAFRCSLGE